ncbi:MAG: 1-deoxy-D-xylulose-5-phosphate reductoisomerase [Alphaproteobacteria bacterium]|nr:1-deoxy-D-xylulose-5-phosphate reductoisomerase [Alphaproteobacteria bacterium]
MTAKRRVTILGATGSVGQSTLDLIRRSPEQFDIYGLSANRSVDALARDAKAFGAKVAAIADESLYADLKDALAGSGCEAVAGEEAVIALAEQPVDYVMAAIVGAVGLKPTMAAVRTGTCVAFANKECLVSAGRLMMREVATHGTTLLPVDSEHNAIFQVFESHNKASISRLILTASGGPFRTWSAVEMAAATPDQAVAHPNWSMGAKISIDSASMMNKGLELIEAHYLFDMPEDKIEIVVHPQSVIHSMVEYTDGSVLAQLGSPDMRTPIANTLAWPNRMHSPSARLNFLETTRLDFEAPDPARFPSLRLARDALIAGPHAPCIMNAANEVAVAGFLKGRGRFSDIWETVERVINAIPARTLDSLDDVFALDNEARAKALEFTAQAAE